MGQHVGYLKHASRAQMIGLSIAQTFRPFRVIYFHTPGRFYGRPKRRSTHHLQRSGWHVDFRSVSRWFNYTVSSGKRISAPHQSQFAVLHFFTMLQLLPGMLTRSSEAEAKNSWPFLPRLRPGTLVLKDFARTLIPTQLSIEGYLTLTPPLGWSHANIRINFTATETRGVVLPDAENRMIVSLFLWTLYRNVTDRQMDGRTESLWLLQRSALRAMRTRCKKTLQYRI